MYPPMRLDGTQRSGQLPLVQLLPVAQVANGDGSPVPVVRIGREDENILLESMHRYEIRWRLDEGLGQGLHLLHRLLEPIRKYGEELDHAIEHPEIAVLSHAVLDHPTKNAEHGQQGKCLGDELDAPFGLALPSEEALDAQPDDEAEGKQHKAADQNDEEGANCDATSRADVCQHRRHGAHPSRTVRCSMRFSKAVPWKMR